MNNDKETIPTYKEGGLYRFENNRFVEINPLTDKCPEEIIRLNKERMNETSFYMGGNISECAIGEPIDLGNGDKSFSWKQMYDLGLIWRNEDSSLRPATKEDWDYLLERKKNPPPYDTSIDPSKVNIEDK